MANIIIQPDGSHQVEIPESLKPTITIGEFVTGRPGKDGKDGYTPIKGIDYFDGAKGENPLTISDTPPSNPKKGDLWYKP